jgi:hypothetical protein
MRHLTHKLSLILILVSVALGAVDSSSKRASVVGVPLADGSVTTSDRLTIGGLWGGMTLSEETPPEIVDGGGSRYGDGGSRYDGTEGRYDGGGSRYDGTGTRLDD